MCAEARAHGITRVRRGHPAYQLMYDGDGDGAVCEKVDVHGGGHRRHRHRDSQLPNSKRVASCTGRPRRRRRPGTPGRRGAKAAGEGSPRPWSPAAVTGTVMV